MTNYNHVILRRLLSRRLAGYGDGQPLLYVVRSSLGSGWPILGVWGAGATTVMEDRGLNELRRNRPAARGSAGDDGLTIVELMIALFVVMIVFAGLAATMVASFSSIRNTEARVRAVALANELVEEMASAPWAQLGMELAADPNDDPNDFEGEVPVLLDASANPILPSETTFPQTFPKDGHAYRVERWVTWAEEDGEPELLKRIVAIVEWDVGGQTTSVRSDTLRAPDPLDTFDLEVSVTATSDYPEPESTAMNLRPKDHGEHPLKNARSFDVTATLGIVESTVVLRFPNRDGDVQTIVGPSADEGESERTWTIPVHTYEFRHGATAFTVYATGPDGQLASSTATMRFYQPLEIQEPEVRQDGDAVSVVTVDADGVPCEPVTVEVDVEGMTPGEAAEDPEDPSRGGLRLISPDGDVTIDEEMFGDLGPEEFGGRFIAGVDGFTLVNIPSELPGIYPDSFEVEIVADRLDDDYNDTFRDDDALDFTINVEVVLTCTL